MAAEYAVGTAYYYGDGAPKDPVEGLAWLYLSNAAGTHKQICDIAEKNIGPESVKRAKKRAADLKRQIEMRSVHPSAGA